MHRWLLREGPLVLAFVLAFFAFAAWRIGGASEAYAVLIGEPPPSQAAIGAFDHVVAVGLSLLGWLAVPAVVGAVAGLIVERRATENRKSLERMLHDQLGTN